MKGLHLAEWLLRQVTTPDHASAQLGDLLELAPTRGPLWFWRSVFASIVHLAARPTLAFLAAFAFSQLIAQLWNHGLFGNRPDMNSVHTTGSLLLVPLTIVPVFSLIRFGWRDTYARLALLFALLFALGTAATLVYHPHPALYWILGTPILIGLICMCLSRRWTHIRPLAQLASAVAINLIGMVGVITSFLLLCIVLSVWLQVPGLAFNVMQALGSHPLVDLLDAAICLLMIRTSNRIRDPRPLSKTA